MRTRGVAAAILAIAVAACQGAAPGSPPAAPSTAAGPSATVAAASSGPTPTSAATNAKAVVDGLRAFASDPSRTFRISFTGDSRHTTDILDVAGTLDVRGEDAALSATFKFPREGTGRTDYRRVGGTDWIRIEKGKWRQLGGVTAADVVDPFAGTHDGTQIQFLGAVKGATDRYRLQLTSIVLHPVLIPAYNLGDERVLRTRLTLVTDGTGRPVSGTWSLSGTGRVSGQLQAIEMDLDLKFSKIGAAISIKKP